MIFLNTIFLLALPLALAPLLLHLFDRRRNVTIEWGAMDFLLEAATRRTSARRLKQWLLLLLRVLAVAALVMALTRPKLPGHWFGAADQGETILVIDNSMSTQRLAASQSQDTLFRQILDRARQEIAALPGNERVRIITASPYPVWMTPGDSAVNPSSEVLENLVAQIQPTTSSSDLLASLFTAIQADSVDQTLSRNIILLTDGQAVDWKVSDQAGWSRFQEALNSAPIPSRLNVIQIDPPDTGSKNVAIDSLVPTRDVVGVGQVLTFTARIRNHSQQDADSRQVRWLINNQEVEVIELPSLNAGETHDLIWRHQFSKTGPFSVRCVLKSDADRDDCLLQDNDCAAVVEVREEIPVLVVESSPGQGALQQDSWFLQAAMGWVQGEAMEEHSVFRPTTVSPAELEAVRLSEYRAVVIPAFTELSEESVKLLRSFTENGGGVWIGLGPRTNLEMFNQYLFDNGSGLSPLALEGISVEQRTVGDVSDESESSARLTMTVPSSEHPATRKLADADRLDANEVRIRRRFRFAVTEDNSDVSVLLTMNNGEPLAIEKYSGQGRVIVMGIPLTMKDWSDLARSQSFVVMVEDWLSYLTQPQATRHNLRPGESILVHLPDQENRDAFLIGPSGDQTELSADPVLDGVVFRSSRTVLPGEYQLKIGLSGESIPFVVQRDSEESNLSGLTADDQKMLAATAGLSNSLISGSLSSDTQRDPIWPLLLMVLIGVMSLELVLSGVISRERFGGQSISEVSDAFGDSYLDRTKDDFSRTELLKSESETRSERMVSKVS